MNAESSEPQSTRPKILVLLARTFEEGSAPRDGPADRLYKSAGLREVPILVAARLPRDHRWGSSLNNFVRVASVSDLQPGQGKVVEAEGRTIALYNCGGTFYAIDNTCLHRGGPLGEGMLEGTTVTCPWHGWTYDVTTGVCPINPNICIKTYPVKVQGSDVHVGL